MIYPITIDWGKYVFDIQITTIMGGKIYMGNEIPQVLYHYCSVETFYNIIVNKTLWLTDSFSTNDYMENRWINKKIDEILPEYMNEGNRQRFEDIFLQYNVNDYIPFISCFSEEGDILSQWRAYANDGRGVSIGFNTAYFNIKHQLPYTMAAYNENSIGLHEVFYDSAIQAEIIKALLEKVSSSEQMTSTEALEIAARLKQYSFVFKNPAFFEEREWRIIHTPLIMGSHKDGTTQVIGAISECKFRVTINDIAPYFLLSFTKRKAISPIAEIILGPKNQMEMYKIRTFLSMNDLRNITIKFSESSYR